MIHYKATWHIFKFCFDVIWSQYFINFQIVLEKRETHNMVAKNSFRVLFSPDYQKIKYNIMVRFLRICFTKSPLHNQLTAPCPWHHSKGFRQWWDDFFGYFHPMFGQIQLFLQNLKYFTESTLMTWNFLNWRRSGGWTRSVDVLSTKTTLLSHYQSNNRPVIFRFY